MTLHVGHIRIAIFAYLALLILVGAAGLAIESPDFSVAGVLSFLASAVYSIAFYWALARAVLLRHMWARIAGVLFGAGMVIVLPSYWKMACIPIFVLFAFGWKYRDDAAEKNAKASDWEKLPLTARFGSVHLLYSVFAVVCVKVAPTFNELYVQFGVAPDINFTPYISMFGGFAVFVTVLTLAFWAVYPSKNAEYAFAVRTLFWGGVAVFGASLFALYGPIFFMEGAKNAL